MSNLAKSAVTINGNWTEGGPGGRRISVLDVTLVLTGQGGGTNLISAQTCFGFTLLVKAGAFTKSDDSDIQVGCASYDRTGLLFGEGAPGDVTGTYRGLVYGNY